MGLIACAAATTSHASAWTLPKGEGQAIVKYEHMTATEGFGPDGSPAPLPGDRRDSAAGVFVEYGVTDRLTVQFKGDWQRGEDAFVNYDGRGPAEIGVTWQVYRGELGAMSLYGGYALAGEGRNAGYAAPGVGESDWEVRLSAGRSVEGGGRRFAPDRSFVEVQAARRMRDGLPDETRADVTVGAHLGDDWLVLGQAYGGLADDEGPRWLSVETSVVRHFGAWSVQGGWRRTVAGRETPVVSGPVVAVWLRF